MHKRIILYYFFNIKMYFKRTKTDKGALSHKDLFLTKRIFVQEHLHEWNDAQARALHKHQRGIRFIITLHTCIDTHKFSYIQYIHF